MTCSMFLHSNRLMEEDLNRILSALQGQRFKRISYPAPIDTRGTAIKKDFYFKLKMKRRKSIEIDFI